MGSARPSPARRALRERRAPPVLDPTLAPFGVRALLGAALALLGAACDFPEPEACTLACGPAGECPSAFECQPETLLCAPRGMREPCTSTVILPGGGDEPPPDAGGRPAPSEPGPSEPGDAGESPGPSEPPPIRALSIERSAASPACTGAELDLELRARGGLQPYAWRLLQAPAGVRLSAASGSVVALAGVPEAPGPVLVEVVDDAGQRAVSQGLPVRQRPSIETSALPVACAGAGYSAPLDGWGGDVDAFVWSARLVTDDAASSLEELGLAVVGSSLSGAPIPESLAPGSVYLELGLSDGWCEAENVELELALETLDADACPSIAIPGLTSGRLPPPCRGNRFTEAFRVEGGVPPFTWTELAAPPGLYLDVDSGAIDGVPSEDGELGVAVTDGDGRTVEARFDVRLRDQCWLAYVAGGLPPARLMLVDPLLLDRQPENARRVFPEGGAAAVQDYQFSPDGRFIAYRSGLTADALGLELVRVVDGATASAALPESAAEYAWSLDSAIVFVATGSAQRVLHAVDVSGLSDGDDEQVGLRQLAARSIPTPSGPFAPFGTRGLAFSTPDGDVPQRSRLVTISVEGSAIAPPRRRSELDFSAAARVTGAAAGALVADPEAGLVSFFPRDGRPPAPHPDALVSGALAARVVAGRLAVFDAANAAAPLFELAGCARLLARSTERDRFACVGDPSRLAFFELRPTGLAALTPPRELALDDPFGARRVFSSAGRWFASPDGDGLSVWSFDASGPRRAVAIPSAALGAPVSSLSFSPDERRLVIGAGNRLEMLELGTGEAPPVELATSALLDDGCSERSSDGLEQWCGSDSGLSALQWAPGSDLVAFRSALGTLTVVDVSGSGEGRSARPLVPDADCDEACMSSTSARFQP